jgi:hypothetical protein
LFPSNREQRDINPIGPAVYSVPGFSCARDELVGSDRRVLTQYDESARGLAIVAIWWGLQFDHQQGHRSQVQCSIYTTDVELKKGDKIFYASSGRGLPIRSSAIRSSCSRT